MVRKLPVLIAVAAALAFGVAACGDDDESSDTGAATSETTTTEDTTTAAGGGGGGGETVQEVETDFKIDPSDPTVPAGTVTFEISNDGEAPHNIEIEGNGVEEVSDTFDAGQSGEFTVDLEPGEYDFYCAVDGHKDLGMDGTLTVQ